MSRWNIVIIRLSSIVSYLLFCANLMREKRKKNSSFSIRQKYYLCISSKCSKAIKKNSVVVVSFHFWSLLVFSSSVVGLNTRQINSLTIIKACKVLSFFFFTSFFSSLLILLFHSLILLNNRHIYCLIIHWNINYN